MVANLLHGGKLESMAMDKVEKIPLSNEHGRRKGRTSRALASLYFEI